MLFRSSVRWILEDWDGVSWRDTILLEACGRGTDLLADSFDVWELDPFGTVLESFVVESQSARCGLESNTANHESSHTYRVAHTVGDHEMGSPFPGIS